jgi:hypothetical protein
VLCSCLSNSSGVTKRLAYFKPPHRACSRPCGLFLVRTHQTLLTVETDMEVDRADVQRAPGGQHVIDISLRARRRQDEGFAAPIAGVAVEVRCCHELVPMREY